MTSDEVCIGVSRAYSNGVVLCTVLGRGSSNAFMLSSSDVYMLGCCENVRDLQSLVYDQIFSL